jgi:anti-sigma factor RsiW
MNPIQRLLMPDCARVAKVLQSYLDGELDDRHAAMVAAHLEHCDRCGIEADVYERVKDQLSELRQQPDPDAVDRLRRFADRVAAGAEDDDPTG